MVRGSGRKANKVGSKLAGPLARLAVLPCALAASLLATTSDAHTGGLLASPEPLSMPTVVQPQLAAQQSDGQSNGDESGSTSGTGSNAGPGQGGATVNVGGNPSNNNPNSQQGQTDQPAAEKPKPSGPSLLDRFGGSSIYSMTATTLGTIFKGYQPDYNPTVYTMTLFAPRFTINKDWQLRARTALSIEYTNGDFTTYRNEFQLADTALQLFYRGIPAYKQMMKLTPFLQTTLPTSKASRARTMYFAPGAGVQLAIGIEHFLGGEAIVILQGTYSRPIYRQTTGTVGDQPYEFNCGGQDCGTQLAMGYNARDTLMTAGILATEFGDWAPGTWMSLTNQWSYTGSSAYRQAQPNGQMGNNLRTSTFFALWLDYHLNDWLTPEIGYQQQRMLRTLDGGWGNPFFDKNQQQVLYLAINIQVDSLLKKIAGQEGQAGVVRAKNKTNPEPVRFF